MVVSSLSPHRYASFAEGLLEHGDRYLAVVEDTGGQCGIGTPMGEHIGYIRSDYVDLTEIPYENQDSTKTPLFFSGGVSTGIKPSASALGGSVAGSAGGAAAVDPGSCESAGCKGDAFYHPFQQGS